MRLFPILVVTLVAPHLAGCATAANPAPQVAAPAPPGEVGTPRKRRSRSDAARLEATSVPAHLPRAFLRHGAKSKVKGQGTPGIVADACFEFFRLTRCLRDHAPPKGQKRLSRILDGMSKAFRRLKEPTRSQACGVGIDILKRSMVRSQPRFAPCAP